MEIYFPYSGTAFFNMFHSVGANGFYAHWKLFIFGAELFAAGFITGENRKQKEKTAFKERSYSC